MMVLLDVVRSSRCTAVRSLLIQINSSSTSNPLRSVLCRYCGERQQHVSMHHIRACVQWLLL
jgi:hypothetical protein